MFKKILTKSNFYPLRRHIISRKVNQGGPEDKYDGKNSSATFSALMHTNVHATPKHFEKEDKIKPKFNIFSAWSPKCPDRDKLQGPVFFLV